MKKRFLRWTGAEIERVCAMLAGGMTQQQVADALGCKQDRINDLMKRVRKAELAPKGRPADYFWSDEKKANFRVLWAQESLNRRQIADRMGITFAALVAMAHRMQLPHRRGGNPHTAAKEQQIAPVVPRPADTGIARVGRMAGWREISDWWMTETGRREWYPPMAEVNARRREAGRPPYVAMRGLLSTSKDS
jgi:hypothetical protein